MALPLPLAFGGCVYQLAEKHDADLHETGR